MQVWIGDIEEATLKNETFRTALFTGKNIQLTVMSLAPAEEIGWEAHPDLDQFIRVEQGRARVEIGSTRDDVDEAQEIEGDWAVIIPGGLWHNVVNIGTDELKLYSLYAPPEHPPATVHETKAEADAAHDH